MYWPTSKVVALYGIWKAEVMGGTIAECKMENQPSFYSIQDGKK